MADAQTALRNAEEALRQALANGASDQEIKQLMDKLRAGDGPLHAGAGAAAAQQQSERRSARSQSSVLSQRDLQNMLDRLENMARSGSRDAAQQLLSELEQMMENLQMASPNGGGDDDQMMSALDELGDMIRQQQDLRDRTFRRGQAAARAAGQPAGPARQQGQQQQGDGPAAAGPAGAARPSQQAARRAAEAWPRPEQQERPAGKGQGKGQRARGRPDRANSAAPAKPWARPKASSAAATPTARSIRRAARSMPCARARSRWRSRCSSRWARGRARPPWPLRPVARRPGHRSARPAAARARLRRRLHRQGAGRDRCAARPPHHRGIAQALRRPRPPAGRTRLHRAAVEGLLIAFIPVTCRGHPRLYAYTQDKSWPGQARP